jgi:hypothetical protein
VTILTRAASFAFAEGHRDDRIRLGKAGGRKGVLFMFHIPWDKIKTHGVFTVLFICLFIWVINTNDTREKRYQETETRYHDTIDQLSDIVKVDLRELKAMHQK